MADITEQMVNAGAATPQLQALIADAGLRRDIALEILEAVAPMIRAAALDEENAKLRGLLWFAWSEFNAIRARSGAPLTHDGMTTGTEEWWGQMTEAFGAAIGDEARKPWPSPEADAAIRAMRGGK